jgi:hypothetical protein
MKKLLILLFIPFGLSAQFNVTDGEGNRVFINGDQVRSVGIPDYTPSTDTTYNGEPTILWTQKFDDFGSTVPKNNLNTTDRNTLFQTCKNSDGWGFDGIFNVDLVIDDGDTMIRFNMLADEYDPPSGSSTYKVLNGDLGDKTELWQGIKWRASSNFFEEDGGKMVGGFVLGEDAKFSVGGAGPPYDGIHLRGNWNGEPSGDATYRWYYYWINQATAFGDNSSNFELPRESGVNDYYKRTGDWHYFASRIVANTAGDSTQQYIEGWDSAPGTSVTKLSHRMDSLRMRDEDSLYLDYIPITVFRGGNDAPSFDTYIEVTEWWLFEYPDAANTITDQERGDATMVLTFPWDL